MVRSLSLCRRASNAGALQYALSVLKTAHFRQLEDEDDDDRLESDTLGLHHHTNFFDSDNWILISILKC